MNKRVLRKGLNFAVAKAPTKREKTKLWIMIMASFGWMAIFIWWFWSTDHKGYVWLYWPLTIALVLKLMRMGYEWYHYMDISVPESKPLHRQFTVDMLTTACPGEPHRMIIRTLKKMVAVKYPHTTYLCDEGDDPVLKKVCQELGVVHVTRKEKINAKAGNINNALKQATGEFCIIMDPDHEPVPEFIDRVLPYFEDPEVGYVQCAQGYYNQRESFVARAAAEQTYHFYGPMMMCMNSYGTPQAIGANCTFRRAALDDIGGHAAGLTEDMHTSMKLQAKGWKCLYIPEMLSKGLVPADVSAWYKQQIKWGRGTFELFGEVLPSLLSKMTWRQVLHHAMSPVYYLSGLVALINILVPILSLLTGEYPWKVDIETFVLFYAPLLIMTTLIRQYSQRWLLEESERGFHIRGGLLQLGTWWVYVVALVYSIFKVNVPYIPTPKEGQVTNNWKLVSPNLLAAGLSIAAAVYGLFYDYNPYSIFMSLFALVNASFLLYFSLSVQQKLLLDIKFLFYKMTGLQAPYLWYVRLWNLRHTLYAGLRRTAFPLSFMVSAVLLAYTFKRELVHKTFGSEVRHKDFGGFYCGLYLPENNEHISFEAMKQWHVKNHLKLNVVSIYQAWGPESIAKFPDSTLNEAIEQHGMVPMITWEPWTSTFPEFKADTILGKNRMVMYHIAIGTFDTYLQAYAQKIKALRGPVFLRFAHEPDNPQYPWSAVGWNTADQFVDAHRYIVDFFKTQGVTNVTWVWNPWYHKNIEDYYPGDAYVDWVATTTLNYGDAAIGRKWKSISDLYEPFRKKFLAYHKPVMFSEFGSTPYGGDQALWLQQSLNHIHERYDEVRAVTFFHSTTDKYWASDWRPSPNAKYIDWTFDNNKMSAVVLDSFKNRAPFKETMLRKPAYNQVEKEVVKPFSASITKGSQGFELLVQGKPFYVKGVAYNKGHDWKDGNIPLTKNYLKQDLGLIKAMGANTIRRYNSDIYDQNILDVANHHNLKVIYGFWFDPAVDYSADTAKMNTYLLDIQEKVLAFKNDTAVLMWCLGNETWTQLDQNFGQPRLYEVKKGYATFLNKAAQIIKHHDPQRAVMAAMAHSSELAGELHHMKLYAPLVDILGINSYAPQNTQYLDATIQTNFTDKPYLVTEFGPRGHWEHDKSEMPVETGLREESDLSKSQQYEKQWKNHIAAYKGRNLGGIAYCWNDRLEGTATWFGISDYKGRLKYVYHALKQAWTHKKPDVSLYVPKIKWTRAELLPGTYAGFKVAPPSNGQNYTYEWILRSESTMEEFKGYVRTFDEGKNTLVKMPLKPDNYRLYIYATDHQNNVFTASFYLPIKFHLHNPHRRLYK